MWAPHDTPAPVEKVRPKLGEVHERRLIAVLADLECDAAAFERVLGTTAPIAVRVRRNVETVREILEAARRRA